MSISSELNFIFDLFTKNGKWHAEISEESLSRDNPELRCAILMAIRTVIDHELSILELISSKVST